MHPRLRATLRTGLAMRVLRVAVALLVLQLTGAAQAAVALIRCGQPCAVESSDDTGDCEDEKSGTQCPPDCPTCHCVHGGIASLPSTPAGGTLVLIAAACGRSMLIREETAAPTVPDLPSVFRPPRASRRVG